MWPHARFVTHGIEGWLANSTAQGSTSARGGRKFQLLERERRTTIDIDTSPSSLLFPRSKTLLIYPQKPTRQNTESHEAPLASPFSQKEQESARVEELESLDERARDVDLLQIAKQSAEELSRSSNDRQPSPLQQNRCIIPGVRFA